MPKKKQEIVIDVDDLELTPVEKCLCDAQGAKEVVCITIAEDGDVEVLTTIKYMPDVLWAMELARAQVLDTSDDHDD